MARYVGIDLGTTNSTVSVANLTYRGDIEAQTLRVAQVDETGHNIIQEEALPSVLYIDNESTYFVGHYAKRMHTIYTDRVIKESKTYIGSDYKWSIDNDLYYADKVASFFLGVLKREVEKTYDEKIDGAVITIPASFHFQQQQATRDAAILAGFHKDKMHMLPEPTAALIDYLNDEKNMAPQDRRLNLTSGPKTLMVFDLGGGTCDVSILQVKENLQQGIDIQELSISQYMGLGGRDFDAAVVNVLLMKYIQEIGLTPQELVGKYDRTTLATLNECFVDFAERAKKSFSTQILASGKNYYAHKKDFDQKQYASMLPGHLPADLVRQLRITKKEYDDAIKPLLFKELDPTNEKNIEKPILSALKDSRIGPLTIDQIDAVFSVGGMTYYPTIKERVYDIFNNRIKPLQSINPMISVSRGAAIYHRQIQEINILRGTDVQKHSKDSIKEEIVPSGATQYIVPNNIYINVSGGDPIALLKKGTILPHTSVFEDTFYVGSTVDSLQDIKQMRLNLFTAEKATSMKIIKLKDVVIDFTKSVKKDSKLILRVDCNKERDVTVTAWLEEDPTAMLNVTIAGREYTAEEIIRTKDQHNKTNVLAFQH